MRAVEFIKKFGWDEAKTRLENANGLGVDMWLCGWGFHSKDLQEYVDAYELVRPYMGSEDGQWFFIADYCKKNRISPFDSENYEKAKGIYLKAITLVEECQ